MQSLSLAAQAYGFARDYARERVQGVDVTRMRDLDAPRVAIAHHPDRGGDDTHRRTIGDRIGSGVAVRRGGR